MTAGRRIAVRGTVQGVGFRPWVFRLAQATGVSGRVRNDAAGVTIEAFGPPAALDDFVGRLAAQPPPPGRIRDLQLSEIAPEAVTGFAIEHSQSEGAVAVSIPPDLATCPACLAETLDPGDRRHGYAFTNCTSCGPRFTIALDVPYDRPVTTMRGFRMCPACQREYDDPADRRFHAQPNACPDCGPRLALEPPVDGDPIAAAAALLAAGEIVGVKGLGGFHLACDAGSAEAVALLRRRKRRDEKPFAVMVPDLDAARRVAELTPAEEALLQSTERPIVLLRARDGAPVAAGVAPDTPLIGLFLPYTPLHHLLLRAAGRPLVMTSGNLSDEPIARGNDEARERLAPLADHLLLHDRDIATRCDDSVARVVAGAPMILRRSRGHVPRPIVLRAPVERPVLAVGAQLKNTFCLALGDLAYLGPHVGDLDNPEALAFFREAVERMERLVHVKPDVIAHDLHPDYLSTRYALERPEAKIAVQHHHAHVASAMAEHGLTGPVLGVAFDGMGYGTDGAAWGGELLLASYAVFRRLATMRPVLLPGGDAAIRAPWRIALALLTDAFDGDPPLRFFAGIPAQVLRGVTQMLARGFGCPPAHGVGRYFDGIGALVLGRARAAYEGQVAAAWNHAADPTERGRYPFALDQRTTPWTIDLRPMVRAVVADLDAGRGAGTIAARFHRTLVAATAEAVRAAAVRVPVVLTGGCFQNALLAEGLIDELGGEFDVRLQRAVPPGDGGIALGQAAVAGRV